MLVCARCRSLLGGSPLALAAISPARCRIRSKSNKPTTVNTDYFVPPTFGRLEVGDQAPILNGYTTNGFVVRNNFVYGSVALLPRTLLNWKVPVQYHQNSSSYANQLCFYSSWAEMQKLTSYKCIKIILCRLPRWKISLLTALHYFTWYNRRSVSYQLTSIGAHARIL